MPEKNPDCRCATQHYHGTTQCYRSCGCRIQECKDANAEAVRALRRKKAYGTSTTHQVKAAPVRRHLQKLMKRGWGVRAISRETGVSVGTLTGIAYEIKGKLRQTVSATTAEQILAFSPLSSREKRQGTGTDHVDATGSHRRLQALATLGFSLTALAEYAGYGRNYFKDAMAQERIGIDRQRAVTEVYERLWNKVPIPVTPTQKSTVARVKKRAEENGWLPPMAWDDDLIDNPNYYPPDSVVRAS